MNPVKQTDVVIAGGGMAGLNLALALAQGGFQVVVADAMAQSAAVNPKFDGRVSALAYASVRMLEALEVWQYLAPHAQPIAEILVTDGKKNGPASPFSLHFDPAEIGAPALGSIVENRYIRAGLFAAVSAAKNLTLLAPAAVTGLTREAHAVRAELGDGTAVRAALCVAADGRDSPLRESMGIGVTGWSYPQTGIVATVGHERPHYGVAYEHFLPSGPFAILPMTQAPSGAAGSRNKANRSSLVWTEKTKIAERMLKLPDAEFDAEIARRFGDHLGATSAAGPRWSYPLSFHIARRFIAERFALVGDSAHGIHPIAGQGLNLGLKDAAALAETLLDAARLGLDIGSVCTLSRYERWRRFDSFTLAAGTDALNRLFSNDIALLRLARDLGLGLVDAIGPARRFFMRHAGGDVGKLPRLMRGEPA